jgi:hypothetical protein
LWSINHINEEKSMFKLYIRTVLTLLFAMALLGCYPETALDRNWGRSFESAKHQQILNPEAGKNLEPVVGLPGPAEERIIERYITGGKTQKQTPSEYMVIPRADNAGK